MELPLNSSARWKSRCVSPRLAPSVKTFPGDCVEYCVHRISSPAFHVRVPFTRVIDGCAVTLLVTLFDGKRPSEI